MLTFDASAVLRAVTSIRSLELLARDVLDNPKVKSNDVVNRASARQLIKELDKFSGAIAGLDVKTTALGVIEMRKELTRRKIGIVYRMVPEWIGGIGLHPVRLTAS